MTRVEADDQVVDELGRRGVVAVIRAGSPSAAVAAGQALARGGITALEVAFTTPEAAVAIRELRDADRRLLVGAGTVTSATEATAAAAAGAQFLASPHLSDEVLAAAGEIGVLAIPGVFTPTEVFAALGRAPLLKLFPAGVGGPALLAALRGPFPSLRAMPTGGVSAANLGAWFAAGAHAVGAGSDLCPPAAIEAGDLDELERRARLYSAELARPREEPTSAPS